MAPDKTPMTAAQGAVLWNETDAKLGGWILKWLQTMQLPDLGRGSVTLEHVSTVGTGQVRRALLTDTSMHQDIVSEVATQFWYGIRRGVVPGDADGGWLYRITQRTTWRHATARARTLFAMVESRRLGVSALDLVPSPGTTAGSAERRQLMERLSGLVAALDEDEQRVLEAKLDDRYSEVAAEMGRTPGSIRVAAHRVCRKLRAQLGVEDTS